MGEVPEQLKPHVFKKGESGNLDGRPKGGLKDYDRKKFLEMSDKDKEKFLKTISPELRYRMAEGNPHQTSDGELEVTLPKPLLEGLSDDEDNNGNKKTPEA